MSKQTNEGTSPDAQAKGGWSAEPWTYDADNGRIRDASGKAIADMRGPDQDANGHRIASLSADNARMREALNRIAAWSGGPVVGPHFDSPENAEIARAALRPADTASDAGSGR